MQLSRAVVQCLHTVRTIALNELVEKVLEISNCKIKRIYPMSVANHMVNIAKVLSEIDCDVAYQL